jgi:hypothetical protein
MTSIAENGVTITEYLLCGRQTAFLQAGLDFSGVEALREGRKRKAAFSLPCAE